MRQATGGHLRRLLPRLDGARRVWLFSVLLAATAALLFATRVSHLDPLDAPFRLSWWFLAALFYATEIYVVHIEFRRDAHSFSLSEIPLVLGLFFATPVDFVLAQVIGALCALGLNRRQSPLKLAFNTSHFFLEATVAALLFNQIVNVDLPTGPVGWAAALVAVCVTTLIAVPAIFIAISLSEGKLQLERFLSVLGSGLAVTATNTSLALIAVVIMWQSRLAGWLLVVPTVTVFVAYRAYTAERQKRESLDFLYRSSRVLQESKAVEEAVVHLLNGARETFRGDIAEILIFPSSAGDSPLRTTIGPEDHREVMIPVHDPVAVGSGITALPRAVFLEQALAETDLLHYLSGRKFTDAMVAPLHGETRVVGLMVLANRLGDVSTFDAEDLRLFETLANQASISLENGRLEKSLAQLSALKEELKHQATHDPLTRLANRVLFTNRVEHALSRRDRSNPIAVLFLDLDDFKTINDSLGHAAGDELLVAVADRLRSSLRAEDTAARLGGDEFGILIQEMRNPQDAIDVAERITATLATPFLIHEQEVFVHASLGIVFDNTHYRSADELLRNADVAMYEAKGRGKSRYEIYRVGMHDEVVKRLELKAELERAVANEQFTLHYQPVVSLESGRVVATEALVRWLHPDRGMLPPSEFISLAEETGLIVPLSQWVLDTACRQARVWQEKFPGEQSPSIAVNLSPRHIQQPTFVDDVLHALRVAHLPPTSLVLELTENVLMGDSEDTIDKLQLLKDLGVRIALDDFGNGFSSLGYLKRFPLDVVKIPKGFVDDLGIGSSGGELVDAMIKLGRALGLTVVAEGIEEAVQLQALRVLGCDEGQGFYFTRPVAPGEIESLLTHGIPSAAPSRAADEKTLRLLA